jgi:multidrug resistance efflux pump
MPSLINPSSDAAGTPRRIEPGSAWHASRSWKRRVIWLAAAGTALAIGAVLHSADAPPPAVKTADVASVPTITVSLGSMDRTIMVAGPTSARNYATIKVPAQRGRGTGALNLVKLIDGGTEVKKGDVVAQLDPESMLQQLDDFEDNVSQAEANLRTRKAQQAVDVERLLQTVRSAKAQLDQAAADYKAADVKTDIERQLLKLSLDEEQATYDQQLKSLPLQQISIGSDLRTQEISYAQLLKRRERMQTDLKNYTFTAPMDGMVVIQTFTRQGSSDMVQYKLGDTVSPGQAFMKIVDTSSMQVEARANQTESGEIRVGQPAAVSLDAFPGVKFTGRVYSLGAIAVQGQSQGSSYFVRAVPVTIEVQGRDPRFIPDLSGAAEIRVGHKENVIVLPQEAMHTEGGKDFVYVKSAQGFEKREVRTGLESATRIEIASGLKVGEQVALASPVAAKK